MLKNISTVLIWSDNYRALADWYVEKLELQPAFELNHPNDTGVAFLIGNVRLFIGQHSKVHGKNLDPHRHMFNFIVDSVSEAYERLQAKGVEFYAPPFQSPTYDTTKYFATFYDLDGNFVQLYGDK